MANSTYKKLAVQWLNEALCFVSSFMVSLSFMLHPCQLLLAVHHISEYLNAASVNGFELVELKEWFDEENKDGIPRLIGIVLRKSTISNK